MPFSITIPTESVAMMDGEEQVMPQSGDTVSVTIEGTVESIGEGGVSVYATTANGVDLAGDEPSEPTSDRSEMLSLLEGAQL